MRDESCQLREVCKAAISTQPPIESWRAMVLNPSKTQFVLLRRPGTELPPGTAVNCRGTSIVPSAYAWYLGTNICLSQPKWMQYVQMSIGRSEHLSMQSRISAFLANDFSIYRSFSPHLSLAALHIFIAYHKPYTTSFLLPAA